jgi:hypothetical protein
MNINFIDSFDSEYQKYSEIEATNKYKIKEALLKEKYKNNRFICVGIYTFTNITLFSRKIDPHYIIYDRKMKKYYVDNNYEYRFVNLIDIKNNNTNNHKIDNINGDYYYHLYDKKDYSPMIMHNNKLINIENFIFTNY